MYEDILFGVFCMDMFMFVQIQIKQRFFSNNKNIEIFKGTISVISSEPPFTDNDAQFTTEPLNTLCDEI